jgi:DNA excision repair protein ERCC-2
LTDLQADQPALAAELAPSGADLQRFYFDALHFARLAESFGAHSLFDITLRPGRAPLPERPAASTLCIRNIVPAPHLQPRLAAAQSVVLFSATLSPQAYHADLLGLPANTAWIDVPSPFAARQLSVRVARHISTRWADRSRSLAPIVDAIAGQFAARPGLYLAFFSSYDYLDQVFARLREQHPDLPCWEQQRQMPEAAREAFLARFTPGAQGVGFAVLGGAFAEGIDLPGERLIGAFIATLGLPQVNPVNEQIRARMEAAFAGRGYDYTYLYPGLQKVVQAAGRVIRSPADEGVLVLMDDRFSRAEVRALLPAWWEARETGSERIS